MNCFQISQIVQDVVDGLENPEKAQEVLNATLLKNTTFEQEILLTEALITIREVELSKLN